MQHQLAQQALRSGMNASNKSDGLSTAERAAGEDTRNPDKTPPNPLPLLPPDLWAEVLPFLPFGAALQCTAVCKSFLHDVAPIVREISVVRSGELRVKFAQRFRGVRKVQIGCLFKYPAMTPREELKHFDFDCIGDLRGRVFGQEYDDIGEPTNEVDSDEFRIDDMVVSRTTPFITALTNLRKVDVGGFFLESWEYGDPTPRLGVYAFYEELQDELDDDDHYKLVFRDESTRTEDGELTRALEMSIGGAYSTGAISQSCEINGVDARCPEVANQICPHCVRVSKCFPVPHAANRFFHDWFGGPFETCGDFDVTAIECLRILMRRKDDTEYLKSEEYLYNLLFRQSRFRNFCYQEVVAELVRFSQIDRETMLKLIYRADSESELIDEEIDEEIILTLISLGLPVDQSDVELFSG